MTAQEVFILNTRSIMLTDEVSMLDLANSSNIGFERLNNIFKNSSSPTLEEVEKIAEVLNTSYRCLI
jgi:hypothetical protein